MRISDWSADVWSSDLTTLGLRALLAWLQYRLWFGHGGAGDVRALSQQVEQQRRDNGGLQQRNDALAAEVAELKSEDGGAAVAERARSELGMIKPGETFSHVVEDRRPVPPTRGGGAGQSGRAA